jgi:putative ABC transport system substrate-binding protein
MRSFADYYRQKEVIKMIKYNRSTFQRQMLVLTLFVVVCIFLSGCKEKPEKVYRVGIVFDAEAFVPIKDGFKAKMTELGYIEGKNIVYEDHFTNMDPIFTQQLVKRFVEDNVDLIFTFPTPATVAANAATQGTNIPVLFAYVATEGSHLVKSVREPGGNITGVRYPGHEMMNKRLEILLEIAPDVKRVWIGYDTNNPNTEPALKTLRPTASSMGVTLVEVPATTFEELKADLAARSQLEDLGLDAMILMPDGFNHSPAGLAMLSDFTAKHKVLLGGSFLYTVKAGAVFGNANDLSDVGELAAPLASKILKGIPAGTIPVVTPEQDIWINYKVAQELGLNVPEGLLSQAAMIIR